MKKFAILAIVSAAMLCSCKEKVSDDSIHLLEDWSLFLCQEMETNPLKKMYYYAHGEIDLVWGHNGQEDAEFWADVKKIWAEPTLTPLTFIEIPGEEAGFDFATSRDLGKGGLYRPVWSPDMLPQNPENFDSISILYIRLPELNGTYDFALVGETMSGKLFRSPVYRITSREYTKEEFPDEDAYIKGNLEVTIKKI